MDHEHFLLRNGAREGANWAPLLAGLYSALREEGLGRLEASLLTSMTYVLDSILGQVDPRNDQ